MDDPLAYLAARSGVAAAELTDQATKPRGARLYDAVPPSEDLERILALPRRDPDQGADELVATLTNALRTPWGTMVLRPRQALALAEIYLCRGALLPIMASGGKTLITRLAPLVLGAARAVLFVPKKLERETVDKFTVLDQHWLGVRPRIIGYELLSSTKQGLVFSEDGKDVAQEDLLHRYRPDLVILDEAHKVKSAKSVVRKTLGRYKQDFPDVPYIALSGTFAKLGIIDYAHVAKWCLPKGSPLPTTYKALEDWSAALDDKVPNRLRAGQLLKLCNAEEKRAAGTGEQEELDAVRMGFRRRLHETPGVIASLGEQCEVPLTLEPLDPGKGDAAIEATFHKLRSLRLTPTDDAVPDGVTEWSTARELSLGLHYYWSSPAPLDWLDKRKETFQWARQALSGNGQNIYSFGQLKDAVLKGRVNDGGLLAEWAAIEPTFIPNPIPAWHSDEAIDAAAGWLADHPRGVVWSEHTYFARRLAQVAGVPYFGEQGEDAKGNFILNHKGPCIASRAANGEGRCMEWWDSTLFMTIPQSPLDVEQTLARVHRDGQKADVVRNFVWIGCFELIAGVDLALIGADATLKREGGSQRILYATRTLPTLDACMRRGGARWVK